MIDDDDAYEQADNMAAGLLDLLWELGVISSQYDDYEYWLANLMGIQL